MQNLSFTINFHDRTHPDGIFTMHRSASPAIFLYTPRALAKEATTLEEIKHNELGIYLLYGAGSAYIGKTTRGVSRLIEHDQKKNFWQCAFMMLSSTSHFSGDMISCLESKAIAYFQNQNTYLMINACNPVPPIPSNIALTDVNEFLEQFLFFIRFKTLQPGSDFFAKAKDSVQKQSHSQEFEGIKPQPIQRLKQKSAKKIKLNNDTEKIINAPSELSTDIEPTTPPTQPDRSSVLMTPNTERVFYSHRNIDHKIIKASLVMRDDKYVLLKGSYINFNIPVDYGSGYEDISKKLNKLRTQLFNDGKIISTSGGDFILIEDYVFNNPNAAGMFVFSTSFSGRQSWKAVTGEKIGNFMPTKKAKGFSAK